MAKRVLLPKLARESGCWPEYLDSVAAFGKRSHRNWKRVKKGRKASNDEDNTTPDARLANAELSLVSILADACRDLDAASSDDDDRRRRLALRVARREAIDLVRASVAGSSRLWGGVMLAPLAPFAPFSTSISGAMNEIWSPVCE